MDLVDCQGHHPTSAAIGAVLRRQAHSLDQKRAQERRDAKDPAVPRHTGCRGTFDIDAACRYGAQHDDAVFDASHMPRYGGTIYAP
jgi:hypothetical protein